VPHELISAAVRARATAAAVKWPRVATFAAWASELMALLAIVVAIAHS
jgi:hypothetical protein